MSISNIHSLADLQARCSGDRDPAIKQSADYQRLAISAAKNLGGYAKTWQEALKWLTICANDTTEEGVVQEINFCIDLM